MEKSYCQFSNTGGSWLSFPEPEEDSDSEGGNNNVLQERHATLLPRNEMQLYGHCPAHDNFSLVTCNECGKILKTLLFTRHCEIYHKNLLSSIPTQKLPPEVKRNKNIKVMQPKVVINKLNMIKTESMDIDTIDVKIEEAPPVIPKVENNDIPEQIVVTASNVVTNHALKKSNSLKKGSKDSPRKFLLTKDREYDPNRHCGVWVEELQKNCTRSLTCKTHALSLRRAVPGRIKEFDMLLLEHRERVNLAKEQQLLSNAQNMSSNSTGSCANKFSDQRNGLASQAVSGDDDQSDLQYLSYHPKPLACCKFGARRGGPGHYVFNRRSDHLRTTVLSMVERLLHPTQSRQTVGKHSVHRRYNTKTAGQSSNQGSNIRIDASNRARSTNTNAAPTNSTVFRNSNKQKTSRSTSSERGSQSSRTSKQTSSGLTVSQHTTAQRSSSVQGNIISDTSGLSNSQNVRVPTGESSGAVNTTEMESSLTLGKNLGIADPASVSVILNGPITTGDLLSNHVQTSSAKGFSQVPSPRGSYVIPASPSSPASGVYCKTNQVANQVDVSSAATTAMSPPTVFQRQTSTGSQQLSTLVNGTAPSPPAGGTVKGYTTNFVPKSSHVNTKAMSSNAGHSMSNFVQGQTVVFANTNISQLQGQPISQSMTPQINQDKTHAQSTLFQRPLTSPGRTSCQPPSPQIPSPGRQSPQRSPSNAPSPKYQHPLYLNHQHIPVSTQAPIAQLKQQVENQGQQLQQIKFQQLQQQQSHNPPRQQGDQQQQQQQSQQPLQHSKPPQYRTQQRIAPAPIQPSQQTTYLLQQSQTNHTLSLRPANGQVLKTSNTVFITNDNPPREIQFSLSRNAANTVG
ncbi:ataxin-7-like isoform X2 [Dendronephthya gigantea]|uniref:ataxin-7-like isoform X2 n=1 Tax=Dendronephthya gigantea TaxID=151771 RepID=UPI00106C5933|nr:ataxin-7-like isoform X2 [Dendronephthya gigantea]